MRVMHVIEAMHRGGAESMVIEHVRYAARGTESWVCALNRGGPALEQAELVGARVRVIRRPGAPALLERPAAVFRLARLMREGGIDVVNGHNPGGALFGTAAAAIAGIRCVVRTEHSIHYAARHSVLYRALESELTRRATAVVCVCEAVRVSHAARFSGQAAKFVTVANGIGEAAPTRVRSEVRRELGASEGDPVVLTVGSLTPQKAQSRLIEALAVVRRDSPTARLWIAGEGALHAALQAQAAGLGLGNAVSFLGDRPDVTDLMAAADLFALPSEREGLSITLLEAMRAGLPVVASDVGGNAEAVEDGVTGHVVRSDNLTRLAGAIGELLEDPERRRTFGRAARQRWSERYTAARMVAATEALYAQATGPASAVRGAA